MRMTPTRDTYAWLQPAVWRIPREQRYLFLLSHMRSYSSVLAHVLGSSPEIDGSGEMHIKYRRKRDLWRLRYRVRRSTGAPLHGRWLLDKILHNYIRSPESLTGERRTRALIFLRKPHDTLRSIVTLARHDSAIGSMPCPQQACDYYVARLHRLRADAERMGKRALYFDAETLIVAPHLVLGALTRWLELRTPLTCEYRLCKSTGARGFGDPLENIRTGHIVDAAQSTIAADVRIPRLALAEAEAAYWRCKETLMRHCELIDGGLVASVTAAPSLTLRPRQELRVRDAVR